MQDEVPYKKVTEKFIPETFLISSAQGIEAIPSLTSLSEKFFGRHFDDYLDFIIVTKR